MPAPEKEEEPDDIALEIPMGGNLSEANEKLLLYRNIADMQETMRSAREDIQERLDKAH
jgi:hypothetical protein